MQQRIVLEVVKFPLALPLNKQDAIPYWNDLVTKESSSWRDLESRLTLPKRESIIARYIQYYLHSACESEAIVKPRVLNFWIMTFKEAIIVSLTAITTASTFAFWYFMDNL